MTQAGSPRVRSVVAAAAAWLLLAPVASAQTVVLVYSAKADAEQRVGNALTRFADQKTGAAPVIATVLNTAAVSGTGVLSAASAGGLFLTGDGLDEDFTITTTDSVARADLTWRGASLDPIQAGLLARLRFAASGSIESQVSGPMTIAASGSFSIVGAQQELRGSGSVLEGCSSFTGCFKSEGLFVPKTGTFQVMAGQDLLLRVQTDAGQGFAESANAPVRGTSAARFSLSYTLDLVEDRRHWALPGAVALAAGASWVEGAAPDAASWAVFNASASRNLGLLLPGPTTWRGLIVDGESLNLDLGGEALTLGSAGPSEKTYSIRVGEGRPAASSLTLRNGSVVADNDVLVGTLGRSTSPLATLTLDGGAVLTQRAGVGVGSIAVGGTGPGALVVRGGSTVFTNLLSLAGRATAAPDTGLLRASLDITGPGSRIEAVQVSLGARGDATATVRNGGLLQTQALDLAAQAGSLASLTVDGAGSVLRLSGGFAQIGAGGRATLQAIHGGAIEGNSSSFTVGSGDPTLFSVLRVSGLDTRLTDAGVQVNTGGLFELADRADWAGPGNLLAVQGGQATLRNATARLSTLTVEGQFKGDKLVSTGLVDIDQGSVIDAAGANFFVRPGGRLTISGAGTRVSGFNDVFVEGTLTVNLGAVLEGSTIATAESVVLFGTGTIKVDKRITFEGQLNPGNSPGLLRIEGDLTMTDKSRLVLEVAGTAAGTDYDVLQVTGDLDLQGGRIDLHFIEGFAPRAGDQFVLLDVGGSFANRAAVQVLGLQPGWQFDAGFDVATGQLTVQSLSNGVSAVPESSSWVLLLTGLALLRWRGRAASRPPRASVAGEAIEPARPSGPDQGFLAAAG